MENGVSKNGGNKTGCVTQVVEHLPWGSVCRLTSKPSTDQNMVVKMSAGNGLEAVAVI
jgi:hypothetical protein